MDEYNKKWETLVLANLKYTTYLLQPMSKPKYSIPIIRSSIVFCSQTSNYSYIYINNFKCKSIKKVNYNLNELNFQAKECCTLRH